MCTSRLLKWLWLLLALFCLFTGIPNLDALHAEYYEDPQRTTMTICTTYCYMLWYILLYSYYCYISLCICIISGIGSLIYGNPFYYLRKWLNISTTLCIGSLWSNTRYLVIYHYIYLYYYLYYVIYIIIETLFTPPSQLRCFWMNSRAYKLS